MKTTLTITAAALALSGCSLFVPGPICDQNVYHADKADTAEEHCPDSKPLFGLSQGLGNDRDRSSTPASKSTGTPDYTLGEPRGIAPEYRPRREYEDFDSKVSDNPPFQDVKVTTSGDLTITVDQDGNVDISTPGDLTIEASDGCTKNPRRERCLQNKARQRARAEGRNERRVVAAENAAERAVNQEQHRQNVANRMAMPGAD